LEDLNIPVGNIYVEGRLLKNLPCRYVDGRGIEDEDGYNFQIFYNGNWLDAYNIDFE
jgi:hypothetical protein